MPIARPVSSTCEPETGVVKLPAIPTQTGKSEVRSGSANVRGILIHAGGRFWAMHGPRVNGAVNGSVNGVVGGMHGLLKTASGGAVQVALGCYPA